MGSSPSSRAAGQARPYLSIYFVNIFVRDQERSLRFYVDQLGFDLAFDASYQAGHRWFHSAFADST